MPRTAVLTVFSFTLADFSPPELHASIACTQRTLVFRKYGNNAALVLCASNESNRISDQHKRTLKMQRLYNVVETGFSMNKYFKYDSNPFQRSPNFSSISEYFRDPPR